MRTLEQANEELRRRLIETKARLIAADVLLARAEVLIDRWGGPFPVPHPLLEAIRSHLKEGA